MDRTTGTERARQLRRASTDAERALWRVLRARGIGPKFRRQEPIGPYIVDFVALDERVVIELDGGQHAESRSDPARDAYLRAQGFTVLRFWNSDVLTNLEGVVSRIRNCFVCPSP
ncbi:MAG: endonuclease domain-containing protein [Acidobacteria bacterium]|nr:endonuclease domain-containing protein [Acidobacteriota bacterium]